MNELLGTRKLAKALGVVPSAVTRAFKEGRITPAEHDKKGNPLYDLEPTRRQWRSNTAPRASTGQPGIAPAPDNTVAPNNGDSNLDRYNKARADKEEAIAAQEMLKLAELRKTLLPKDKMVAAFTQFLRAASQAFSGLPARVLSRHPGLSPDGRDNLTEEIRIILDDLSRWSPEK
jgi:hypothetical protein